MEFILNTNTIWDAPPRARHQLAYALSEKQIKVTFVAGNVKGKVGTETLKINDYLDVIIPSFPISSRFRYRTPLLNEGYQLWLYSLLKKRMENKDVYVICFDFGGYLAGRFFDKTIYFANDDYINNVQIPAFLKLYTVFTQRQLIISSKFTLATAQKLVSDFSKYNKKSFELPLGAPDYEIKVDKEAILRKKDGIIKIVLLGYLDKVKTPLPLLLKILEMDNAMLYLIGPVKDDILEHLHPANKVVSLGTLTGEDLMDALLQMDVAIAPYYMEDSNTGRTPNKMWQYLATGKPAVITNLPNVKHWVFPEGTVYKANTEEQFIDMINKAYHEDNPDLIEARIALAKNNSWGKRAERLLDYIKENFN